MLYRTQTYYEFKVERDDTRCKRYAKFVWLIFQAVIKGLGIIIYNLDIIMYTASNLLCEAFILHLYDLNISTAYIFQVPYDTPQPCISPYHLFQNSICCQ